MKLLKTPGDDISSIHIVDDNGTVLVKLSGPMAFCAAGAFIKYNEEAGLVRFAFNFTDKEA